MNYGIEIEKGIHSYEFEWTKTPHNVATIGNFVPHVDYTDNNGFPINCSYNPMFEYWHEPPTTTQINFRKVLSQCGLCDIPLIEREQILSGIEGTDRRQAHSSWSTAMEQLKAHKWILPMIRDEKMHYLQAGMIGSVEVPQEAAYEEFATFQEFARRHVSRLEPECQEKLTLYAMDADHWDSVYEMHHTDFQRLMHYIDHLKYAMPKHEKLFIRNGGQTRRERELMDENVKKARSVFFYLSSLLNVEYPKLVRLKDEAWSTNFADFGRDRSYLLKANLSLPTFPNNYNGWHNIEEMQQTHIMGHYVGCNTDEALFFERKYKMKFAQEVGVRFCLHFLDNEQDDPAKDLSDWYNGKQWNNNLRQRWKCKWYLEEAAAGPYGWQLVGDKYYKVLSSISINGLSFEHLPHTVYPAYSQEYTHGQRNGGSYEDYLGPILEHTLTCARYYLPRDKLNMTRLIPCIQQYSETPQGPVGNMLQYEEGRRIPKEWYNQERAITQLLLKQHMNEVLNLTRLMRTTSRYGPNQNGQWFVSMFAIALKDERYKSVDPLKIRFFGQIWDFLFNSNIIDEDCPFIPQPLNDYMQEFGAPFNLEDPTNIAM